MITKQQWIADEERQSLFAKLIKEPVMQEALAIARAQCTPLAREVEDPAHILTLYALDHARAGGWYAALSALESLCKVTAPMKKNSSQPWKHKEQDATK